MDRVTTDDERDEARHRAAALAAVEEREAAERLRKRSEDRRGIFSRHARAIIAETSPEGTVTPDRRDRRAPATEPATPEEPDDEPYPCGAFVSSEPGLRCRLPSDHAGDHEWVGRGATPEEHGNAWLPAEGTVNLKKCPKCGAEMLEGFTYCSDCGCEPADDTTWRATPEEPVLCRATGWLVNERSDRYPHPCEGCRGYHAIDTDNMHRGFLGTFQRATPEEGTERAQDVETVAKALRLFGRFYREIEDAGDPEYMEAEDAHTKAALALHRLSERPAFAHGPTEPHGETYPIAMSDKQVAYLRTGESAFVHYLPKMLPEAAIMLPHRGTLTLRPTLPPASPSPAGERRKKGRRVKPHKGCGERPANRAYCGVRGPDRRARPAEQEGR